MARHGNVRGKIEKPKDLKSSTKRLTKELKDFKLLIGLSIVLAIVGSILTIITPNKLSDMVDEISLGIRPRVENIEPIAKNIQKGMKNRGLVSITIDGVEISVEDQMEFAKIMQKNQGKNMDMKNLSKEDQLKELKKLESFPKSIKKVIEPKMDLEKIKNIAIVVALLYFISSFFTFIQSISMTEVANRFAKKLRNSISEKINRLPLTFFDKNSVGDILSRVTNDIDTIAQSMNQSLASLFSSIVQFLGTIIMMFYTNWQMAVTAIVSSTFGFIFMFLIIGKSQKYFSMRQKSLGKLNGHIEEVYSGLNIVKSYNAKNYVLEKFDQANYDVYKASQMSQFLSGLMMPLMIFIGNLGYVAICIVGAVLTIKGKITFGVIVAFMSYVRLFTSPLSQIGQAMTSIQSTAASSERVFEFLDEKEMEDEKEKTEYLDPQKAFGNIGFENVEFSYEGNKKPTITNFSADIKKGQKVAIVGPTGAGKTTMVNLLMKFYQINKGDIIIDGKSINDLKRENIHDLFTMVLQDTWLFKGTIRENILFNRKDISEKRLNHVIKSVSLDHFIKTLPKGLDSKIDDDDSVSQGQRQLLTIARAMIDDKPFLILDEATSNVDTRSEELVQEAMDKLAQGRTSFIIAHRLSTIKNADLILVMDEGNIIEQGNHNQLMEKNGFYADLYNSQFSL
ncbi:MAG: ABC transporter ATP-binding protein [Anaerococcus vaginalis]|uniref:ABC transporter ATP-binding protein n=1 Tax=Anaerococcus vaginalis TaxID=33037 RepID=UPI00290A3B69|nr:ABC transporter ATP-binding protein [Anaerococcus vaginalis]MDU4448027.1 ABC transporter ATP-binding protein [Anaerococcus vaginalis]MDU6182543.1 ABC transporter ATP-binding protein [Anaerococcus vaginalis]MDU7432952.1 ABC transporter ATP-binding protein [Anaerococcus vaginalis]